MTNYNNSNVIQYLRQYDMFSNSLHLINNTEEKQMIIKQLTKLEYKIIDVTNETYLEEYNSLLNQECGLFEDEKKRLLLLIDLINQRLSYIEKRQNNHYELTGESLDIDNVPGADTLDNLEKRVKIIDKYQKNIKLASELNDEVDNLSNKIALASKKIDINKKLNIELEDKFIDLISKALSENQLFDLIEIKDDIEHAYYETEKSLTLAELNSESAKTSPMNVYDDCQTILEEVKKDYIKYKDELSLVRLIETYNKEVKNYQELFDKRKEINDLFKYIKNDNFVNMVIEEVTKQYNTILLEQQDVETLNDLTLEKERKQEALSEIEEENNSDEFQTVLKELIANEKKKETRLQEEKRKIEEEEKKKRLEIEKKRQEEILKRQKVIEEARKKEIEKRTKVLLEQQQNSVLQSNNGYSFSTIKDNIDKSNFEDIEKTRTNKEPPLPIEHTKDFKDRNDIEKELFDEFNSMNKSKNENEYDDDLFDNELLSNNYITKENKLPNVSLDEYMKKFDENDTTLTNNFFDHDDTFPTIPM